MPINGQTHKFSEQDQDRLKAEAMHSNRITSKQQGIGIATNPEAAASIGDLLNESLIAWRGFNSRLRKVADVLSGSVPAESVEVEKMDEREQSILDLCHSLRSEVSNAHNTLERIERAL